jgi:signal transduction histidine kinase
LVVRNSPTEIVRLADAVRDMAESLDARAAQQAQLAQEAAVNEERQRLARDLHDSVSQTLSAIGMASHSALTSWESKPQVARNRIELAGSLARRAQAEMRALIFELRPDQLEVDGLVQTLRLQAAALAERREFTMEVSICEEPEIPVAVKEVFYRVAQEAMQNAVRHARATRLELKLASGGADLTLLVKDDGKGFDPAANYPGHLGLRSMRERAARIGADLKIESALGETSVRLWYWKAVGLGK